MTEPFRLYEFFDGDAYVIDVSPAGDVTSILCYRNNLRRQPEMLTIHDLDESFVDKLNNRIAKLPTETDYD